MPAYPTFETESEHIPLQAGGRISVFTLEENYPPFFPTVFHKLIDRIKEGVHQWLP